LTLRADSRKRVDLVLSGGEKNDPRARSVGDDKDRVNSSSLESPLTILAD
jgi:hypothetical protein